MESRNNRCGRPGEIRATLTVLLILSGLTLAACGGETANGGGETDAAQEANGTESAGEETLEERALSPVEATVGPEENTAMPASGREEDTAQPPPEDPPEGVQTFPATSNGNFEGPLSYEQDPPTNGDHSPGWQKCGFYSSPIENERAVHSMDHGAVWITYQPNLPQDQIEALRSLAREDYVLVSPYPGLRAPVIATAWRNQLELEGTDDPRLRQFVDQFRVSETAPRSGNGCENGGGEPETS